MTNVRNYHNDWVIIMFLIYIFVSSVDVQFEIHADLNCNDSDRAISRSGDFNSKVEDCGRNSVSYFAFIPTGVDTAQVLQCIKENTALSDVCCSCYQSNI